MNYGRLALAAVVAWIVDFAYGYVVFGVMLANQFAAYPAVYRPMDAVMGQLPLLAVGSLVGMFVLAYIYAKGYEGGSGVAEGVRFGILVGLFLVTYVGVGNYVMMNVGRRFAAVTSLAGLVEFIIDGAVLGALYKPAASGAGR
jgi:hypothetical protein